jgi:uncharacterized membrane protein
MENARRLTTRAVAFCLAVSAVCFLVGSFLAFEKPPVPEATVIPALWLGVGLDGLDPVAWLSLGVLALLAAPSVRVAGMLASFRAEGDRRALASGAVLLAFLGGNFVYAVLAQ